jgi:hypothetical protein
LQGPYRAKVGSFGVADRYFPPPSFLVSFAFADGQDGSLWHKLYILYIQPHKFAISECDKEAHKYQGFVS